MTYKLANGFTFIAKEKIPNERKWLTIDDDGQANAFIEKPKFSDGMWVKTSRSEIYYCVAWVEDKPDPEKYPPTTSLTTINRLDEKLDKILSE